MSVKSAGHVADETPRRGARRGIVEPDQLFELLDGRYLTVTGRTWRIEVYSIRDRAGLRWVQLALDGAPQHILALRLATGDGLEPAVRALAAWLISPSNEGDILRVASATSLRLKATGAGLVGHWR